MGICGSDAKCDILMNTLQFDFALNYKSNDFESHLSDVLGTTGCDVYFDNVGGSISESVLKHTNFNARVPICGQIASYETDVSYDSLVSSEHTSLTNPELFEHLKTKQVKRFRYLVLDYEEHFDVALEVLRKLYDNKNLVALETQTQGFRPHEAFVNMMNGENVGKAIVKLLL